MPRKLTMFDRIRIERLVWALDQRLYDLPRRSRIAKRREVRANLLEAAADRGTGEALRRMGSSAALAREYLGAEFGDRPHHSWIAATYFAAFAAMFFGYGPNFASDAYRQGLIAAHAASGSYTFSGVSYLQSPLTFTVNQGHVTQSGGAWTPIVYVILVLGTIACGRLWRLLPPPPGRQQTSAGSPISG